MGRPKRSVRSHNESTRHLCCVNERGTGAGRIQCKKAVDDKPEMRNCSHDFLANEVLMPGTAVKRGEHTGDWFHQAFLPAGSTQIRLRVVYGDGTTSKERVLVGN